MLELSSTEFAPLLRRMPAFELSYETMNHKKVLTDAQTELYDIGFAIPTSKKYLLWFTFYEDRDVCLLMELNREKRIVRIQIPDLEFPRGDLSLGTLLYGSCISPDTTNCSFLAEDILWYRGISLQKSLCNERMAFMGAVFQKWYKVCLPTGKVDLPTKNTPFRICMVYAFQTKTPVDITKIPYEVHHFQYRAFSQVAPYMNMAKSSPTDTISTVPKSILPPEMELHPQPYRMNMGKPQYKSNTYFEVSADLAFDIYHLYACGKAGSHVYYGVAYIQGYRTSVFMNSLFRNIKENRNLDSIEESDDEEEFQDQRIDRFVDLGKRVIIECTFLPKFKRWVPIRVAPRSARIVHIATL